MAGILLVHGAWHGAWCWDQFAERLRARGHRVDALNLRDHGTPSRERIWHRISHYVSDLEQAAAGFPDPPAVVGHSMGGLVVQKYLETNQAPAAVLLAPVPTTGALGATLRYAGHHPLAFLKANLSLRMWPVVGNRERSRELFFTPATPLPIADACFDRLQDESYPAYLGMILSLPRPRRVRTPVLVIAGEGDRIFTVAEERRTARAYGSEATVMPGMGHDLMLDSGWEKVADQVAGWVEKPR